MRQPVGVDYEVLSGKVQEPQEKRGVV
jgi:hypothetical protein